MKVIATYNIKGGVGKTATAVNLAWLAAREGAPTLVWDLDPQGAASFYFRIVHGQQSSADRAVIEDEVQRVQARFPDRDPRSSMVTGGPDAIVQRIREYLDGGVSKFVLRPLARGDDDVMIQARRFVEQGLPAIDGLNRG